MTDRELLELAAKAADMDIGFDRPRATGKVPLDWDTGEPWNPLTDDGDAFRLAVKLRMHARQFPVLDNGMDEPLGMVEIWRTDDDDPLHVEYFKAGDDRLVVTRRAIVRAAAEIGRGK